MRKEPKFKIGDRVRLYDVPRGKSGLIEKITYGRWGWEYHANVGGSRPSILFEHALVLVVHEGAAA